MDSMLANGKAPTAKMRIQRGNPVCPQGAIGPEALPCITANAVRGGRGRDRDLRGSLWNTKFCAITATGHVILQGGLQIPSHLLWMAPVYDCRGRQ